MQLIEILSSAEELTLRQRWANVFAVLVASVLFLFGLNLRNNILNATTVFDSVQAGVRAEYPANWLLDTSGSYIFRVRDMSQPSYKTSIEVVVLPIGPDATERNVAETLAFGRLDTLTAYEQLAVDPYTLPDGSLAQIVEHTFVSRNTSPFLQGIPSVVRGIDILALRGSQAVVITFRSEANQFDEEFARFEEFLERLRF